MSARRSSLADDAELAAIAIHNAKLNIGAAALACDSRRAAEASKHLAAAQSELLTLERALRLDEGDG
jgi:hypothetical protein